MRGLEPAAKWPQFQRFCEGRYVVVRERPVQDPLTRPLEARLMVSAMRQGDVDAVVAALRGMGAEVRPVN
jgi:hypothetical protein